MDGVTSVRSLRSVRTSLVYVMDPLFYDFPDGVKLYKGDTLVIEVREQFLAGEILGNFLEIVGNSFQYLRNFWKFSSIS